MTFQFENKERLPDFPPRSEFETYRMNQLVQILERRLGALEESILDIDLANSGFVGGDMYAPISHLHLESEIQDLGDYIDLSFVQNSLILDDISDVAVNSALPGYLLARDPSNTAWVAVAPGSAGGFNPNISGVAQNDILTYNGLEWVNVSQAGAGFVRRSGDIMTGSLQIAEPNSLQLGSAANRLYFDSGANAVVLGSNRDLALTANFIDINSVSGTTTIRGDSVIISHTGVETFRTGVNTVEVWDGDSWEDAVLDTRTLDVIGTANEVVVDLSGPVDLSADRAWTVGLADNPVLPGTGAVTVPTGTTAQEPAGAASLVRYDSDLGTLRFTTGTTWQTPAYSGGAFHDGFSDFVSDEHVAHSGVTVTLTGDTNEIAVGGAAQDIATSLSFTVGIADDAVFPGTGSVTVPVGTTAQEPTPSNGMLRYDSDTGKLRGVEGGAWTDIVGGGGGATDLNSLTDVTLTAPATGEVLLKSGGDWVNSGQILVGNQSVDFKQSGGFGVAMTTSWYTGSSGGTLNASLDMSGVGPTFNAEINSQYWTFTGKDGVGTVEDIMRLVPDGSSFWYYADAIIMETRAQGIAIIGGLANNDAELYFKDVQTGVDQAKIYYDDTAVELSIEPLENNGSVRINAKDGAALETVIRAVGNTGGSFFEAYYNNSLRISSTNDGATIGGTGAFIVPTGTTAQEPAATNGMLRYDSTTGKLRGVEGGAWADIIGGGGATDLDSLTDVTITTPATGGVLYKSAGDWIDTGAIIVDPTSAVTLYHNGVDTFRTKTDGIQVIGTGTASPITNPGGIQTGQVQILNASLFPTAYMGHVGSADLTIKNEVHGGKVILSADDTAGTLTSLFEADPDGVSEVYHNGSLAFGTDTLGASVYPSDTGTNPVLFLRDSLAADRVRFYATATAGGWRGELDEMVLVLESYNTSSVLTNLITGDPDGLVVLYNDGVTAIRTNDGSVSGKLSYGDVKDFDGNFRDIGYALRVGLDFAADVTATRTYFAGKAVRGTETTTPRTLTLANDSAIPVGSELELWNGQTGTSGTNLTIAQGTGVTLRWYDGSGTISTGNRTVAIAGYCKIRKYTSTIYWITGVGIT